MENHISFLYVAIMFCLIGRSICTPVPTIDNPCNFDLTVAIELPPLTDILQRGIQEASSAAASCSNFSEKIKADNVLTPSEFSYFSDVTTQLPGLPLRQPETNVSKANMGNVFTQHYNDTSILLMYLRTAILDQIAFDYNRYVPDLQAVERAMYISLCKTFLLTKATNTSITKYLNMTAVPTFMTNIYDGKKRLYRNLMMVTQGRQRSQVHAINYANFIQTLSTSG